MNTPGTVATHMDAQRRALLVLGMHRSGTSALTRVLNIYGAALPTDLLPANEHNVTGHWESTAVMNFHNRLLKASGCEWDDPIWLALQPFNADSIHDYAKELAELIAAEYGSTSWLAVKDPRMCRFLPIWLEALALLNIQPLPILILRNPFEVAASLRERDGRPERAGLVLWLEHVLAAEYNSRELRRAVLFYDRLLSDCRAAITDIETQLGIALPAERTMAQAQAAAFLEPSLRHQHASDALMGDGSDVSRWVRTTLAWFQRTADGEPPELSCLDAVRTELMQAEVLFKPYLQWYRDQAAGADAEAFRWQQYSMNLEARLKAFVTADGCSSERTQLSESAGIAAAETRSRKPIQPLEDLGATNAAEATFREQVRQKAHVAAAHEVELPLRQTEQRVESRLASVQNRTSPLRWIRDRVGQFEVHWHQPAIVLQKARRYHRIHGTRQLIRRSLSVLSGQTSLSGVPTPTSFENRWVSARELVNAHRRATLPLRLFTVPQTGVRRVSLVTDSISRGSLFGGVGTAIILGALIAQARGARLRLITRTERAQPDNLESVLKANGVHVSQEVEFAHAPCHDSGYNLDTFADELFITTSWWTTASTLASVPPESILYLLQEDERMFYPHGDEHLRCSQLLHHSGIRIVVNTRLLFDHLVDSGLTHLTKSGMWFEPAFPSNVFYPRRRPGTDKLTLALYARPNNQRNLFIFGLDLLETAMARGILELESWDVVLIGHDVPLIRFNDGGYTPKRIENLSWMDYADFVGRVDLGVSLMYTPHPSYPPFDFAASGAVAVTNRFGLKDNLQCYSKNILSGDLTLASMLSTLADGVRLARSQAEREANYRANTLAGNWHASLTPVVRRFGGHG